MTDILDKLRELSYVSPPRKPEDYSKMVGKDVLIAAADEIEKLRGTIIAALDCLNHDDTASALRVLRK